MSRYKYIYFDLLPIVVPSTTVLGILTGMIAHSDPKRPMDGFTNIIGYSTIGIITGFTFPISFPLISAYVLIKNKQNSI